MPRNVLCLIGLIIFMHLPVSAQDFSKVDVFAGGSFVHVTGRSEGQMAYGGVASVAYNVNHFLSGVAEYGVYKSSAASGGRMETVMLGPKISLTLHKTGRFLPYAEWLFGAVHTGSEFNGTPFTSTNFGEHFGVGLDVAVSRHLAVRPFQADYFVMEQPIFDLSTGTNDATFTGKSFRYSGGIVLSF